ncbi:MAG: D-aminoacylase [Nitrospirae bacterium]|nr:D-aminoacylase [Nitrospirota bacterium]
MILITNTTVYDGTGSDGYIADILIDGDRIADIRPGIAAPGARVIDGTGLAAAPGFIDIHAHSEFSMLAEPSAPSKVMQGVTTEVSGNCGLSAAPLIGPAAVAREKDLAEYGIRERWSTFDEFFALLEEARPALNFATLCGHGNIRASVMGYEDRRTTEDEFFRMETLLDAAMQAGAFGMSTGLIYPPGVYSDTDELVRLAKVVARHNGIYASHMRSEGANVIESIGEAIRIGREAGLGVQISHLKTAGPPNWDKLASIMQTIEQARYEGVDVTADRYPYTASSTDLDAILPAWSYVGGAAEELKRLKDPEIRARLRAEVLENHPDPEYWGRVMIASVVTDKNRHLEGRRLDWAAESRGQEPVDALFDILIEEEVRPQAIYFTMNEGNLREFYRRDWMMVGSDSTARAMSGPTRQGKPHPRGFGSFPLVLGKFVREEAVLTLPQAVRKLSSMAADRLGLAGRGYIKVGYYADIILFNPDYVCDKATYEEPYCFPVGIEHVLVNGELAVEHGVQTDARAGRVLRKGRG